MRRLVSLAIFAAGMGAAYAYAQGDMANVEVRAVEIKPGVAVLFGQGGNICVSYGRDGTMIVDDQFAPLTPKIQAAIAGLGATPVRFLVNTHWHFDHAGGNENFGKAGATIVAHENVRERLAAGGTVAGNTTPPAPREALPIVTYDDSVSLHLNGDQIEVIHTGGGHTDGDSVILWRRANVLHTGDMMMNGLGFPFIDTSSGGNVEHLLRSLDQMIAMTDGETIIIPGHGELADRMDLIAWRRMINAAVGRVEALRDSGRTLEESKAEQPLAGLSNSAEGFVGEDQFLEAIWVSLDAHD